jgi:hypothetical protein
MRTAHRLVLEVEWCVIHTLGSALATVPPYKTAIAKGGSLDAATRWLAKPAELCSTVKNEDEESHNTLGPGS